jgi:glycosyltransferase involved in cell wall biosynthesis
MIREQVNEVDGFIAVSDYCASFMQGYLAIPPEKIVVVPLGIDMGGYEPHQPDLPGSGPFRIGYFARIAPEKGLHVLAQAYVQLRRRAGDADMQLRVAGYLSPAQTAYLAQARRTLEDAGLGGEFHYDGELDRAGKLRYLRNLDVLSVPATYDEPKGMFLLEAMASGVPVVQPRRGAFTEVVEKTGGGLLVPADDIGALAEGLGTLLRDRGRAAALGRQAYEGVRQHYTVAQSATRLLDAFRLTIGQAVAP